MKDFHYKLGHLAGSTMTVSDLRQALASYPDDMPVFASWEGVSAYVRQENFAVEKVGKGRPEEKTDCLVILVDEY